VALSGVFIAFQERHRGITFGGGGLRADIRIGGAMHASFKMDEGAPLASFCVADSTWEILSVYGVVVTIFGAAVVVRTKKIGTVAASSHEVEGVASLRGSEDVEVVRDHAVVLGHPPQGPTILGTDNKSNLLVATETGTANRVRHALRRYLILQQRVREGVVDLIHVPDPENPADFLTKFVGAKKLEASLVFLTNSNNSVFLTKPPP
jgi:hypothetical protein